MDRAAPPRSGGSRCKQIIEHAISGAMGEMGVVGTARGMASQTEFKRLARRWQCAVQGMTGLARTRLHFRPSVRMASASSVPSAIAST